MNQGIRTLIRPVEAAGRGKPIKTGKDAEVNNPK